MTYCRFYNLRAEQVEVAMDKSYQYHADLLAATLNALEAQWLCGGAGDVADNLEIDAVIQQPEDNNHKDRAIRRDEQRNAAPDDNPGDDDSDGTDDDDWVHRNNNPGNLGGNDNDDNDVNNNDDDEGPAPADVRRISTVYHTLSPIYTTNTACLDMVC